MTAFRILLALVFVVVVSYTVPVVARHGLGLFPIFFGDIAKLGWPGQFNVDFTGLLTLSGLWLAWRHHFSPVGLALGVLGFLGGAPVLTAYLLLASYSVNGDVAALLLGRLRAERRA
jgi:hypothetical protein